MSRIRQREMHARRVRAKKLAHLREKYAQAKSAVQKDSVLEHVAKIAPLMTKEQFVAEVKSMGM